MSDVFISYSRKDKEFAETLHTALEKSGKDAWIDWQDIPLTSEWWKEIEAGIEGADTFIFVISPDSVASKVCGEEIGHAVKHNKRLFPVVRRDVAQFDPNNEAIKALNKHNWLFFREEDDFEQAFQQLTTAILMDLGYVHNHTRLLVKAIEWDTNNRKEGSLLQKEILIEAESWLQTAINKDPKPTDLQISYIENSRKVEDANNQATKILKDAAQKANQRIRVSLIVLGITLIGTTAAGIFANNAVKQAKASEDKAKQFETQFNSSKVQAEKAEEDRKKAEEDREKIEGQIKTIREQSTILEKNKKQAEAQRKVAEAKVKEADIQLQIATRRGELATQQANNATQTAEQAKRDQAQAILARNEAQKAVDSAKQKEKELLAKSKQLQHEQILLTQRNKEVQNDLENSKIQALATEAKALWQENPHTLDSLLLALKTGGQLQNRLKQNVKVPSEVQWQTKIALQQAEQTIKERNRLDESFLSLSGSNFSPNGKTLVTSSNGDLKLWNVGTGKEIRTLSANKYGFSSMIFFPDDKTLVTSSSDGKIKLWDVEMGKELKSHIGNPDKNYMDARAILSSDGKILAILSSAATWNDDLIVELWDVEKGKELKPLNGNGDIGSVLSVSFSPNSKTLATGSRDQTVELWDMTTGKKLKSFSGHEGRVDEVKFSPDGKILASLSEDNRMKLWNMATEKVLQTLQTYQFEVWTIMSFSLDSKTLVTGGDHNTVKLWDVATGKELQTLKGHQSDILSVSFSPNGKTLATGSRDQTIKLWDVATGKELQTLKGHQADVWVINFSPNGKTLATSSSNGTVKLWDVEKGKELRRINDYDGWFNSVILSPDGKTLAVGSGNNTVKLLDGETGKVLKILSGHQGSIFKVKNFSPDGKTLAIISGGDTVTLWNVMTGKELKSFKEDQNEIWSTSFSPDGKTLAIGGLYSDGVKLRDIETGKELKTLHTGGSAGSLEFSIDGKTLVVSSKTIPSDHAVVRLWDIRTDKELKTFNEFKEAEARFSPNGKTLARWNDYSNWVSLWDMTTGKELKSFNRPSLMDYEDGVYSVSFSPDGKTLATGNRDNTVTLWDITTGKELKTLSGHESLVSIVSFSPDGKTLTSVDAKGVIIIWNFDLDQLMQSGCTWIGAYLGSHPEETELQQICQPYLAGKSNPKP
jgi:WD40 repeat protein